MAGNVEDEYFEVGGSETSNATWTDYGDIDGCFNEDEGSGAADGSGDWYIGGSIPNPAGTVVDIINVRTVCRRSNYLATPDTVEWQFYNAPTTTWTTIESAITSTTDAEYDGTSTVKSAYDSSGDKTAFVNGLKFRWFVTQNGKADEGLIVYTQGVIVQFELTGTGSGPGLTGCDGYYKLDEADAGTTYADSSGNSNDGTLEGGDTTDDKDATFGDSGFSNTDPACHLNGSDDRINCGNSPWGWDVNGGSFSFYASQDTQHTGFIISQWDISNNDAGFHIGAYNDKIRVGWGNADGDAAEIVVETMDDILAGGGSHHVGVVMQPSSKMHIYLNGVRRAVKWTTGSLGQVPSALRNHDADLCIGASDNAGTGADFFDGMIDNVLIYAEVEGQLLDSSDMWYLYNDGDGTEISTPSTGVLVSHFYRVIMSGYGRR